MDKQDKLDNIRHSCAHLLAAATLDLFPGAQNAIGPSIENGFYYDFDFGALKITEEDLRKIEKKMREILPSWISFEGKEVTIEEARKIFASNKYKLELIDDLASQGETLRTYKAGNFEDLCRGGHSENPSKETEAFKLLSIAGAYWRGSEKNKMLTRIYGTCFPSQKELDEYLTMLEEAKKRDHRKLGKDLGLFVFSDLVGAGLPLLTAKGTTIRRILEGFIVDEELKRGYQHVITPPLAKVDLYKVSGHYPYYKETMYPPMKIDEDELILRPMTCPHHFMLYKSQSHSYRELPIKIAEISPQFRYEKSGELTGLMRVRMFTLSDAHIICAKDQAKHVVKDVLDLIDYVNKALRLKKGEDYRFRLSLGDRKDDKKYYKDDKAWDEAEQTLREVLQENDQPFFEAENEAAFYGPKVDIQVKNVVGKEETMITIQYDFVMPKRFELEYTDAKGQKQQPIVIHRSSIGAFERTMAFLIEKYAGAFPVWLSPVQAMIIPISEKHIKYGQKVLEQLLNSNLPAGRQGIRVELDERGETMQAKIRDTQMQKVPFMLIVGDKEEKENLVAVRTREGADLGTMKISEFVLEFSERSKVAG